LAPDDATPIPETKEMNPTDTAKEHVRREKELSKEIKKQTKQIQKLTDENARLKKEIASLKKEFKKRTGHNPGQPVFEIVRDIDSDLAVDD
jgi:cell division protein FtsB